MNCIFAYRCLAVSLLCSVSVSAAADLMPKEFQGDWTHSNPQACGYLSVQSSGFTTQEDLGCSLVTIRRLSDLNDSNLLFDVTLVCQVDDPRMIKASGTLKLHRFDKDAVLVISLAVHPSERRRRISLPRMQVFKKCHGQ